MKDEEEISRILASLTTVDAPENFEGAVRSRIAQSREERLLSRPSLFLVAKFAFPLLLLLVVGGFLVVSNERELSGDMVPPVGDATQQVAVFDNTETAQVDPSATGNVNSQIAKAPVNRGGVNSRQVQQGGSHDDQMLSQDETTLFPDGVDPRKARVTNGKPPTGGMISAANVLLMIGILSECSSTGCVATAVRAGSIAAGAGIQSGDVISAIDGMPVNANPITGKFTVSDITLTRSGRKMTVSIARR